LESVASQKGVSERANIDVGEGPINILGDLEYSDIIYVANEYSSDISVIDAVRGTVINTIPVGDNPLYTMPERFFH
jgi:YVTN family beta-propeller protein